MESGETTVVNVDVNVNTNAVIKQELEDRNIVVCSSGNAVYIKEEFDDNYDTNKMFDAVPQDSFKDEPTPEGGEYVKNEYTVELSDYKITLNESLNVDEKEVDSLSSSKEVLQCKNFRYVEFTSSRQKTCEFQTLAYDCPKCNTTYTGKQDYYKHILSKCYKCYSTIRPGSTSVGSGNKCCYSLCNNTKRLHPGLHFFRIPRDRIRAKQWAINTGNLDLQELPYSSLIKKLVCQEHFEYTDFRNSELKALNKNAYPRVFREGNFTEKKYIVQNGSAGS